MTLKEQFAAAVAAIDKKCEKIDAPHLGLVLYCRVLRCAEQSKFSAAWADKESGVKENYAAEYLSLCLCDSLGEPLFPGDTGVFDLQNMPAHAIEPILAECQRVNGAGDHRKNSEATAAPSSSTN